MGREVTISFPPRRIISVVPSQTELLYDLGLEEEVVGITKFCIHPDNWFRQKTRIGGTKQLHLQQILDLQPDLIIANKEENTREEILYLMEHVPVWVSDVRTLEDALQMIDMIGRITGKHERAKEITSNISLRFSELKRLTEDSATLSAIYLIWRKPWIAVAGDTFIHEMMRYCGIKNAVTAGGHYPVISGEEIEKLDAQLILLSSEPYPFREKDRDELAKEYPGKRVILVDGEMFSWYGSRLEKAAGYLLDLWKTLYKKV